MLKGLRWRLTLLYLLAAMSLVALVGGGAYELIRHYFQVTTDLALQYKMAEEFRKYGVALPSELARAERTWLANYANQPAGFTLVATTSVPPAPTLTPAPILPTPTIPNPTVVPNQPTATLMRLTAAPAVVASSGEDGEETDASQKPPVTTGKTTTQAPAAKSGSEAESSPEPAQGTGGAQAQLQPTAASPSSESEAPDHSLEDAYDARLAPIFVIPLNANGGVAAGAQNSPAPVVQNVEARAVALSVGSDLRTILLPDGSRVRLLTYRTSGADVPAMLQAGRLLADQDRVLSQLLTGLLVLGALISLLLGALSWWLAGRSLGPAQKAWDQQQAFISNASHELRTPLTLIRATAEYGLRSGPDSPQQGVLEDVLHESDYMNRLVDDLLLLSRLDTHRLQLNHENILLDSLLAETGRQVDKLAREKEVALVVEPTRGAIWGDPTRVRQALLILLDNALRFTPAGGTIRLEARPAAKSWQISVIDTGRGIPPEHLPHLFERFYSYNQPGEDATRSNGLGLSIARGLVEAMGGSLSLESQPGAGTHATITLPRAD